MAGGELVDGVVLEEYDGEPVVNVVVKIVKTGDSLSEPMQFTPQLHKRGEKVTIVLQGTVAEIHYRPMKKVPGTLQRVEQIVAEAGGFVENGLVAGALNVQRERVATAKALRKDSGADPLGMFRDEDDGPVLPPSEEEVLLEAEEAAELAGKVEAAAEATGGWETDPPPAPGQLRAVPNEDGSPPPPKPKRARKAPAKTTTRP